MKRKKINSILNLLEIFFNFFSNKIYLEIINMNIVLEVISRNEEKINWMLDNGVFLPEEESFGLFTSQSDEHVMEALEERGCPFNLEETLELIRNLEVTDLYPEE
jgi:hypothetical protein